MKFLKLKAKSYFNVEKYNNIKPSGCLVRNVCLWSVARPLINQVGRTESSEKVYFISFLS